MSGIGQIQQQQQPPDQASQIRQRLIMSMMQPTQNPNTTFGGLANAGSAIAQALALRNMRANPNQGVQVPMGTPPQTSIPMSSPAPGMPQQ